MARSFAHSAARLENVDPAAPWKGLVGIKVSDPGDFHRDTGLPALIGRLRSRSERAVCVELLTGLRYGAFVIDSLLAASNVPFEPMSHLWERDQLSVDIRFLGRPIIGLQHTVDVLEAKGTLRMARRSFAEDASESGVTSVDTSAQTAMHHLREHSNQL